MRNTTLAADYVSRAVVWLRAIDVMHEAGSWADAVRESQETVELALKGLLRAMGIDPPRLHDVGDVLKAEQGRLPLGLKADVDQLAAISRALRRDRELVFYGARDLTPSAFCREEDAESARAGAMFVVERVRPHVLAEPSD